MPQTTDPTDVVQHREIGSLMDELPPELGGEPGTAPLLEDNDDDAGTGADDDDAGAGTDDDAGSGADDDDDAGSDDDAGTGDEDDAGTGASGTDDDDDEDDDYFTNPPEDEEGTPPVTTTPPVTDKPAAAQNDEGQYILDRLTKISVNIVVPGADGKDEVKNVQVYGYGDLPRDYKGFASKYEEGIFNQSVMNQENRASQLQQEFRQSQVREQTDKFQQAENRAIQEDLTDLRKDGLFPKFKGTPGTKEFNESEGAKMFDKVVAYMNKQNDAYILANQQGKTYRHIGFREAFIMLNGPNPNAAQQRQDKARKGIAGKLKTGNGTKSSSRRVPTTRVTNITDLQGEFDKFVGAGAEGGA